jgi:molybdenum cofactor cytidylyltransferase
MRLCDALGVQRGDTVAFIGAGGKSSALIQLAYELRKQKWRVLATTTTRISRDELAFFPYTTSIHRLSSPDSLSSLLTEHGLVFIHEQVRGDKVIGLSPQTISGYLDRIDADVMLVEADGSRRLPLKAPYPHEPVIPDDTTLVVPVAGMDAIGKPLDATTVYNAEAVLETFGFVEGMPIQAPWIAMIVRELGLQGIPPQARIIPLLNKVGSTTLERLKARRTAQLILKDKRVQSVAMGRVQNRKEPIIEVQRRVAAMVLAGGMSRRMGRSKPLLPWGNQTIIETIARRLTLLRFHDTLVVTGHQAADVGAVLSKTGIRTVFNPDYEAGEMLSSFKAGLRALDESVSACMIFLGDQPQINPRLVHDILTAYAEGKSSIVAPSHMNRRGHPILIDRHHWREILDLEDGKAPRDVINAYNNEIAYILTDDSNILNDMDTPEEYRAALKRAGLL